MNWMELAPNTRQMPTVLVVAVEGAEMANGVGSVLAPAHPGQLQALAHHRLARALHRAAADAPALGLVFGILHPVGVTPQVTEQLGDRFAQAGSPWPVPFT